MKTLVYSLIELLLMIALGYFLRKREYMSKQTVSELSNLLISVILPLSVVSSGNEQCSSAMSKSLLECAGIVFGYYVVALLVSCLVFQLLFPDRHLAGVSIDMVVFANTGFIGMPLTQILYGSNGLLFAVVYNLIFNFFFFTVGVRLMGSGCAKTKWSGILLDPLNIASVLAVILFVSPIKLPVFLQKAVCYVGDMVVPLSMIIIGTWLVGADLKDIFTDGRSYFICAIRLLLLPLAMFFVLKSFGFDKTMTASIVLLTAMPIGSLNVLFAEKNGSDVRFVNGAMMLSLILSIVTIPIIMMMV